MLDDNIRVAGWRLGALSLLVFAAMGVLINRLWNVQILNSDSAQHQLDANSTVRSRIAPARGAICDRNGVMLAQNRPSFDIDFYLDDIRRDYAESHHGRVPEITPEGRDAVDAAIKMLGELGDKADPAKKTAIQNAVRQVRDDLARDDADSLKNSVRTLKQAATDLSAESFQKALDSGRKHYPEINIVQIVKESIQPISQTLGMTAPLNERDIKEHFRTDRDLPYHYMTDLDFATVANFEERNMGVTGIKISQSPARDYTYGAFAAHILGYVGKPDNQNEHLSSDGTPYETIGRHGIEAIMDPQLQGEPGSVVQRVSSQGYYIGKPLQSTDPTMGNTLYLTIDSRIQYIAETAMRNAGIGRGAVVVMDPRNGDVLAMVSVPSYDPNKFIPKISSKDWDALNNDPTAPMFNRALHALAPGSTYKIMVALAGLKSGNVSVNTEFDCPGAIQIDDHLFHNSDSTDAGTMSLVHAICVSSDVFFYQYGIRTGIDAIDAMGKLVGFGHKWGLLGDADEDAGIIPGPQWMKDNDAWLKKTHNIDHWSRAQTANTSIGQGFVLTTPLQMATFLCAVANGGTVYQPRLYSRTVDYKGDTKAEIPAGQVYSTLDVKPSDLKAVQEGMRQVVEQGTATQAQVAGYSIAGKTGTAQAHIKVDGEVRRDLKCWFYCYGPFENPRYVTCVIVEGGTWGGVTTAPIAQEIMKRLFAMDDKGAPEAAAFLQPAQGNFNGIGAVDTQTNDNTNGTMQDNNDASSNPPTPDAPPASMSPNSSNSKRSH